MIIKVTQDCIDRGKKGSCYYCPVAIAIGEQTKLREVFVNYFYFSYYKNDLGITGSTLSKEVADKIYHYDRTEEMEPFEFEINL